MKKYNFNAGPSILPQEVIKQTAEAVIDFQGEGLSVLEISHRAKYFQPVMDEAEALVKEMLNVPEELQKYLQALPQPSHEGKGAAENDLAAVAYALYLAGKKPKEGIITLPEVQRTAWNHKFYTLK